MSGKSRPLCALLCLCVAELNARFVKMVCLPVVVKILPVCLCASLCVHIYGYKCVCVCVCVSRPGSRTDVYLPRSLLEKEEATPPSPGSPAPPVWASTRWDKHSPAMEWSQDPQLHNGAYFNAFYFIYSCHHINTSVLFVASVLLGICMELLRTLAVWPSGSG